MRVMKCLFSGLFIIIFIFPITRLWEEDPDRSHREWASNLLRSRKSSLYNRGLSYPQEAHPLSSKGAEKRSLEQKLLLAAGNSKNTEFVTHLIKSGANVNARDEGGWTALMFAAHNNENSDLLTTLLNLGADINARNKDGNTALMIAAQSAVFNQETVIALLNAGSNVNSRNKSSLTVLVAAASIKEPDVITDLTQPGVYVNAKNKAGFTALTLIVGRYSRYSDIIDALLRLGADVNASDKNPYDVLRAVTWAASRNPSQNTIIAFLKAGYQAVTVFFKSVHKSYVAFFRPKTQNGLVILQLAVGLIIIILLWPWIKSIAKKISEPDLDSIIMALKAGADVNSRYEGGITILMAAIRCNPDLGMITTLLKSGADVNAVDKYGKTALMHAFAAPIPKLDVINALLKSGADIDARDKTGKTAFDYAKDNKDLINTDIYRKLEDAQS